MLEKPDVEEAAIAACLRDAYGLAGVAVSFLPLGADPYTAVYRVGDETGRAYFLKLRSGNFDEISVTLVRFLHDHGVSQIIPPVANLASRLWTSFGDFKLILYPFVAGRDGYEVGLSDAQWVAYGAALRRLHSLALPPQLSRQIKRETFAPVWRDIVKRWLVRAGVERFDEPVAAATTALLQAQRDVIACLVSRAERYAQALQARALPFVVCHSDLHAGNFLLTEDGAMYIVDWDDPVLAPKERDLMYPGGGLMAGWRRPGEEEALFYRGYGPAGVDQTAIVYYRYERIIADIAVYCEALLGTTEGGEDRAQSLRYLGSNFLPGGTIALAQRSDPAGPLRPSGAGATCAAAAGWHPG